MFDKVPVMAHFVESRIPECSSNSICFSLLCISLGVVVMLFHFFTFRAAQIWKSNGLVASLLRRSHIEPVRGSFVSTTVCVGVGDSVCLTGNHTVCLLPPVKDCVSIRTVECQYCLQKALIDPDIP